MAELYTRSTLLNAALTATSKPWLNGATLKGAPLKAGDSVVVVDTLQNIVASLASATFTTNLAAMKTAIGANGKIEFVIAPGMPTAAAATAAQPVSEAEVRAVAANAAGSAVNLTAAQFNTLSAAFENPAILTLGAKFADHNYQLIDTVTALGTAFGTTTTAPFLAGAVRVFAENLSIINASASGLAASQNASQFTIVVNSALAAAGSPTTADTAADLIDSLVRELSAVEQFTRVSVNVARGISATSAVVNALQPSQIAALSETFSSFVLTDTTPAFVDVVKVLLLKEAGLSFAGVVQPAAAAAGTAPPLVGMRVQFGPNGQAANSPLTTTLSADELIEAASFMNPGRFTAEGDPIVGGPLALKRIPIGLFTMATPPAPLAAGSTVELSAEQAAAIIIGGFSMPMTGATTIANFSMIGELAELQGFGIADLVSARINVIKVDSLEISVREAEQLSAANIKVMDSAQNPGDRDLIIVLKDTNGDGVVKLNGASDGNNFANNALTVQELIRLARINPGTPVATDTGIVIHAEGEGDTTLAMSFADAKALYTNIPRGTLKPNDFIDFDAEVIRVDMTAADFKQLSSTVINKIASLANTIQIPDGPESSHEGTNFIVLNLNAPDSVIRGLQIRDTIFTALVDSDILLYINGVDYTEEIQFPDGATRVFLPTFQVVRAGEDPLSTEWTFKGLGVQDVTISKQSGIYTFTTDSGSSASVSMSLLKEIDVPSGSVLKGSAETLSGLRYVGGDIGLTGNASVEDLNYLQQKFGSIIHLDDVSQLSGSLPEILALSGDLIVGFEKVAIALEGSEYDHPLQISDLLMLNDMTSGVIDASQIYLVGTKAERDALLETSDTEIFGISKDRILVNDPTVIAVTKYGVWLDNNGDGDLDEGEATLTDANPDLYGFQLDYATGSDGSTVIASQDAYDVRFLDDSNYSIDLSGFGFDDKVTVDIAGMAASLGMYGAYLDQITSSGRIQIGGTNTSLTITPWSSSLRWDFYTSKLTYETRYTTTVTYSTTTTWEWVPQGTSWGTTVSHQHQHSRQTLTSYTTSFYTSTSRSGVLAINVGNLHVDFILPSF